MSTFWGEDQALARIATIPSSLPNAKEIVAKLKSIRGFTYNPVFSYIAFDGTNYLITWSKGFMVSTNQQSKGMSFNTSGVPGTTAFTLFDALGDKLPLIGSPWNQENIVLPGSL